MSANTLQDYIEFRADPENDKKEDTFFAQAHNISLTDLKNTLEACSDWRTRVLTARRDGYAEKMSHVDDALFTAALDGDTKAADLLYRRFDGWNPRIVEQTNNYYNFADIVKDLKTPKRGKQVKREI